MREMADSNVNLYEAPTSVDQGGQKEHAPRYRAFVVTALTGPLVFFPVFMFYGTFHGLSGLFGGERQFGMEGLQRGLFFASFMTMYILPPVGLALLSLCVGFLSARVFQPKGMLYYSLVAVLSALLEYSLLLSW